MQVEVPHSPVIFNRNKSDIITHFCIVRIKVIRLFQLTYFGWFVC